MKSSVHKCLVGAGVALTMGLGVFIAGVTMPSAAIAGEEGAANVCAVENPCAMNPCEANPCAVNPCAVNPCAVNPCAAQNPCAM